jgi:hypothetical protein
MIQTLLGGMQKMVFTCERSVFMGRMGMEDVYNKYRERIDLNPLQLCVFVALSKVKFSGVIGK